MGQARVGQVERVVELCLRQGGIGGIDHHGLCSYPLQDALGMDFVALLLDVAEVGSLFLLVGQALFV